jgi:hypothetical protein
MCHEDEPHAAPAVHKHQGDSPGVQMQPTTAYCHQFSVAVLSSSRILGNATAGSAQCVSNQADQLVPAFSKLSAVQLSAAAKRACTGGRGGGGVNGGATPWETLFDSPHSILRF